MWDWRYWGVGLGGFTTMHIVLARLSRTTPENFAIAFLVFWGITALFVLYAEKNNRIHSLEKWLRERGVDPKEIY